MRAQCPTATFTIVGSRPVRAVRRLDGESGVVVTGTVADVRPFLWNAAVSVAPLHVARGLQNKVLEAIAAGLPVVATSAVIGGIPHEALGACTRADDPAQFAAAVSSLLHMEPFERMALVQRADLSGLTWASRMRVLPQLIANAVA